MKGDIYNWYIFGFKVLLEGLDGGGGVCEKKRILDGMEVLWI